MFLIKISSSFKTISLFLLAIYFAIFVKHWKWIKSSVFLSSCFNYRNYRILCYLSVWPISRLGSVVSRGRAFGINFFALRQYFREKNRLIDDASFLVTASRRFVLIAHSFNILRALRQNKLIAWRDVMMLHCNLLLTHELRDVEQRMSEFYWIWTKDFFFFCHLKKLSQAWNNFFF